MTADIPINTALQLTVPEVHWWAGWPVAASADWSWGPMTSQQRAAAPVKCK
jgi:hypothetical protein